MKKINIFLLVAIIMLAASSCKKIFGDSGEGEADADVVFKYKNENYANYVAVAYSDKKNKVTGYPDSSEVFSFGLYGVKCSEGYYITSIEGSSPKDIRGCYTDITFREYKEIWKATNGNDIRDTLTSRVIDRDPYAEIYSLHYDTVLYKHEGGVTFNIDKINEMIESGDFFTYEGVERIK